MVDHTMKFPESYVTQADEMHILEAMGGASSKDRTGNCRHPDTKCLTFQLKALLCVHTTLGCPLTPGIFESLTAHLRVPTGIILSEQATDLKVRKG